MVGVNESQYTHLIALKDVFGPLDVLNTLSRDVKLSLAVIAATKEPVTTQLVNVTSSFSESISVTHTVDDAPRDIEVLIIPGGACETISP